MIRDIITVACVLLGGIAVAQAHEAGHEHGAHEHGAARLDIAVEGGTVQLDLDSPAVNLVGFEHEPGNAKERSTLDKAVADLKQGGKLMSFTPAAQCSQKRVMVKSGLLEHEGEADHGHGHEADKGHHHEDEADHDHGHEHEGEAGGEEHADIAVFWEIGCARVDALKEIDLKGFFGRFPGTSRLEVQAVLPGGQTGAQLTPSATKLKLSQ
ncbi:MAG: DUF2796 domain-containing protein [Acetobacteraceae bacterium]|uniref:DUF2796 domain-containing protein n=1 Tax=Bradyrhizobium sp. TaxID=376 RepID=UPI003D14BC28